MRPAAEAARRSTQATIAERLSQEVSSMLLSLQQALPQTWRETFQVLATGFTWVLGLSKTVLDFALFGDTPGQVVLKVVLVVIPSFVLVAGLVSSMASLYTLPFRSGRGGFLVAGGVLWGGWGPPEGVFLGGGRGGGGGRGVISGGAVSFKKKKRE